MSDYFDVYFDPAEIKINRYGNVENEEKLHVIRFDEDGNAIDRVDENGQTIPEPLPMDDVLQMDHAGYGDDPTPREALNRFIDWLDGHLIWIETARRSYWSPAEYTCIGIDGYIDDGNPF